MELLTRDEFRRVVFERDAGRCVICGAPAADAHHILERRLFPDGGYYVNNGASLCPQHHIEAEQTNLAVEDIRQACGITESQKVLPPHLYDDQPYNNLASYFYAFSVWNDKNICLSWDESLEWFQLLGLGVVPVLYEGPWDEQTLRGLHKPVHDGCACEGYVVRVRKAFHYRDYRRCVGKYVRKGQVGRHDFWTGQVVRNELR